MRPTTDGQKSDSQTARGRARGEDLLAPHTPLRSSNLRTKEGRKERRRRLGVMSFGNQRR